VKDCALAELAADALFVCFFVLFLSYFFFLTFLPPQIKSDLCRVKDHHPEGTPLRCSLCVASGDGPCL
jgi:hypothetical protein